MKIKVPLARRKERDVKPKCHICHEGHQVPVPDAAWYCNYNIAYCKVKANRHRIVAHREAT